MSAAGAFRIVVSQKWNVGVVLGWQSHTWRDYQAGIGHVYGMVEVGATEVGLVDVRIGHHEGLSGACNDYRALIRLPLAMVGRNHAHHTGSLLRENEGGSSWLGIWWSVSYSLGGSGWRWRRIENVWGWDVQICGVQE